MPATVTRRSFLGTLGAAAAMSGAVRAQRGATSYRIGVESYCFHDVDLAAAIARTRELGLRHIELHDGHLPFTAPAADLERAKQAFASASLKPDGVYIHDAFTDSEAVARPIFEYARTVGFAYINGGPKREALPLLNRLVPEYGIRIALHNHGPKARYETLEDVTSALDAHPNIRACVDIGHFARSRVDPVAAIRAIGRRAVAMHIKDVDASGENAVVGKGTIDMPGVFAALAEIRFDGLMVLEYEGDFDNMPKRMDGMRRSLDAMRTLIGSAK
jgi:sugar phosphate isomerase/epimerase